jgi:hypothetical protein
MPEVHLPAPEEPERAAPATQGPDKTRRGHRSFLEIALEVALISIGVFLGLAGEQWREHASQRQAAEASLMRFRSEFQANRRAVAAVRDKHEAKLKALQTYFAAHRATIVAHAADPRVPLQEPLPDTATDPAFLEYAAWDVALATQSLAHLDPDLAVAIAHVYRVQQQIDEGSRAITATMYSFANEVTFLNGVTTYFGDCVLLETRLLGIYDEILPRLDRAIAD